MTVDSLVYVVLSVARDVFEPVHLFTKLGHVPLVYPFLSRLL